MTLERYPSAEVNYGSYHIDLRVTDDTEGRFSDGICLGIHRVDKGAFYVCPLDPPLLHHFQKRTSCS